MQQGTWLERSHHEQRTRPRISLEVPVRFASDSLGFEGAAEIGRTGDLSEQGLFIRSDFLEPVGTRVRLELRLDGGESLQLDGSVVWVAEGGPKGPGMGILLFSAPQGYLRRLADLVARPPTVH